MTSPNKFECKACGATFDNREQLDAHNRREHPSSMGTGDRGTTGNEPGKWSESGKGTGKETPAGTSGRSGSNPPEKKNS